MAADPAFASTIKAASGIVPSVQDTSLTTGTLATANHSLSVFTAGTSGSKIEEITAVGIGTTVAGILNYFILTSGVYTLFDQVAVTAVTPSATVPTFRFTKTYSNLWLPASSQFVIAQTQASNVSLLAVTAFYGDL